MARITQADIEDMNDRIAFAPTTAAAFRLIDGLSRAWLKALLDANGIDAVGGCGLGQGGREALADAHGWRWSERNDDRPSDGHGPCSYGFSAHSRRPLECRGCSRRRIDHRTPHQLALVASIAARYPQ